MQVRELIKALLDYPPEARIEICTPSNVVANQYYEIGAIAHQFNPGTVALHFNKPRGG